MNNTLAPIEIVVCMGSSCFARGNRRNLEVIQEFIRRRNLHARVTLRGCLCENACREGPHLRIAGHRFDSVDPLVVSDLMERLADGKVPGATPEKKSPGETAP